MTFVDSHAHLELFDDLEDVLGRAKEAGVSKIITIGTSLETSKKAIQIAEKFSSQGLQIYATCGIHPKDGKEDVERYGDDLIPQLRKIAASSGKVVGIGECGLDYYFKQETLNNKQSFSSNKPETSEEEKEFQRKLFADQIKLAGDLNLPLVVHCRNAWDDIFDAISKLKGQNSKLAGVFHSFTGGVDEIKKAVDLGFYISFSGIVTFKQSLRSSQAAGLKNAGSIAAAAIKVPRDKILVETDSPFLTPEPLRSDYYRSDKKDPTSLSTPLKLRGSGKLRGAHMRNQPKNVKITADFIATLRNSSLLEIADMTTRNACEVFGI